MVPKLTFDAKSESTFWTVLFGNGEKIKLPFWLKVTVFMGSSYRFYFIKLPFLVQSYRFSLGQSYRLFWVKVTVFEIKLPLFWHKVTVYESYRFEINLPFFWQKVTVFGIELPFLVESYRYLSESCRFGIKLPFIFKHKVTVSGSQLPF